MKTTTTSDAKNSLSIKLKNARKARRISVQKLAKMMHVPTSTIEAMEAQDNTDLPLANLVGLTSRYAKEVDLDMSELASELEVLKPKPQTKTKHTAKPPQSNMFVASKAGLAVIAVSVLVIILGYALWQAWQLTAAPRLSLNNPSSDIVTSSASLEIQGSANAESSVTVNGANVSLDDQGNFKTVVYLQPGQNFIQVRAINALGHEAVEDRLVVYNQ